MVKTYIYKLEDNALEGLAPSLELQNIKEDGYDIEHISTSVTTKQMKSTKPGKMHEEFPFLLVTVVFKKKS